MKNYVEVRLCVEDKSELFRVEIIGDPCLSTVNTALRMANSATRKAWKQREMDMCRKINEENMVIDNTEGKELEAIPKEEGVQGDGSSDVRTEFPMPIELLTLMDDLQGLRLNCLNMFKLSGDISKSISKAYIKVITISSLEEQIND